jgi:hypothetical protein
MYSLAETPATPPPAFGRYWSAKIDDISLWVGPKRCRGDLGGRRSKDDRKQNTLAPYCLTSLQLFIKLGGGGGRGCREGRCHKQQTQRTCHVVKINPVYHLLRIAACAEKAPILTSVFRKKCCLVCMYYLYFAELLNLAIFKFTFPLFPLS